VKFQFISVGPRVTCGLSVDGDAYCWGLGGTVGDGTRADRLVPTKVAGDVTFTSVSAGGLHACARLRRMRVRGAGMIVAARNWGLVSRCRRSVGLGMRGEMMGVCN
jgi:hypothetical protein